MTGYELLESELEKSFKPSKVKQNKDFICAIVGIVANNPDVDIAMSAAKILRTEAAKEKYEALCLRNEINMKVVQIERREKRIQEQIEDLEQAKELLKKLEECETPEARDKMRLAWMFMNQEETGYDSLAFTRGLSNILGNGASQKKEAT